MLERLFEVLRRGGAPTVVAGAAEKIEQLQGGATTGEPEPVPGETETEFHDVNCFIDVKPHKFSGFQYIPDYVKMTLAKLAAAELGHDDLAELLSGPTGLTFADEAETANKYARILRAQGVQAMAGLGCTQCHVPDLRRHPTGAIPR